MSLTPTAAMHEDQPGAMLRALDSANLKVNVSIDGESVPLFMKQEIKEYTVDNHYCNAYMLIVAMPPPKSSYNAYQLFKVKLTDQANGGKGEGLYYLEK